MANLMQKCIDKQPQALAGVLNGREAALAPFVTAYRGREIEKVYLIGSGSSFHASSMARYFVEEILDVPVYVQTPTQLHKVNEADAKKTLVIAASQSGQSTNTLIAVNSFKKMGFSTVTITADADAPLGVAGDICIPLNIGTEEADQKTMGVMGTIATLHLMALYLGLAKGIVSQDALDAYVEGLEKTISAMPKNIEVTLNWYKENKQDLLSMIHLLICGQTQMAPIGAEGALKLVETIYLPTFAYDFEEFIHGPTALFTDKTQMIFLCTPWDDKERMDTLIAFLESVNGKAYPTVLGETAQVKGRTVILEHAGSREFAAYALLLPMQVLSAYLCEDLGIDIDGSPFPTLAQDLSTKTD